MNSLQTGMIRILFANGINLLISVISGFILPKYLSVNTYAMIKTFQLYLTYIGFFHFGFIDGIYLKYGGKEFESLNEKELNNHLNFLRTFQLLITVLISMFSLFMNDYILFFFSLSLIPINLTTFYKYIYQATGEFLKYSKILNLNSFFVILSNLILLFLFRVQDYKIYIFILFLVNVLVLFIVEYNIKDIIDIKYKIQINLEEVYYIKDGFFLMIGNFSSIIMTSMDRWFIKLLLTVKDFAVYSFAVSIEVILNTFISPLTITLYNYFCKNNEKKTICHLRLYCVIFSSYLIAPAFVIKFIILKFLTKYNESINIIFILFAAQFFTIIVKSIYINLYKTYKMQNKYFFRLMIVLLIACILNILFYNILKENISFACATLCSSVIWLILCNYDFRHININIKEIIYMSLTIIVFIVLGFSHFTLLSLFFYLSIILILQLTLFYRQLKFIYSYLLKLFLKSNDRKKC